MRVSEHDPWFQTKSAQLSTTAKQLREMRSNLRNMAKMKRRLHEATNDFRTGLVTSMLVGGRDAIQCCRDSHFPTNRCFIKFLSRTFLWQNMSLS